MELPLPSEPYKIFANIPFSLSASVVRRLLESENPPAAIYLVVQRQFARKLTMGAHFTSQLGAEIAPFYEARVRRPLQRSDFTPPPGVDTALLELRLRDTPLIPPHKQQKYGAFVRRCFAEQKFFGLQPRESVGISSERKPSELDTDQWVRLFDVRR
jgi:23S rRNA (adenine-N6)-dimethyltransferase